jgi:hypothetical protein
METSIAVITSTPSPSSVRSSQRLIEVISSHTRLSFQRGLFPSGFSIKSLRAFSFSLTQTAISFSWIWYTQYLVRRPNRKAPRYTVFSSFLLGTTC